MTESTKRRAPANNAPARPEKRRRDKEPEPEPGSEMEDVRSSHDSPSPAPVKKSSGPPRKNAASRMTSFDAGKLEALREHLDTERPLVREEDLDDLIGPTAPPLSDRWTQQDEEAMMVKWNASPEKVACESIKSNSEALTVLWKVCLRLLRCPPSDLISLINLLHYKALAGPSDSALLSQEFCLLLTAIIAHPVWNDCRKRLATALQYAVICRTDDRRPWKPQPLCSALHTLRESVSQAGTSKLPKSVHRMYMRAQQLTHGIEDESCCLCDLLNVIHATVQETTFRKIPDPVTSRHGFVVYSINCYDLKVVRKAMDSTLGCTVDEAYVAFKAAKGSGSEMPKGKQVQEFLERAGLRQLRLLEMTQRDSAMSEDPDEPEAEADPEREADPESESESELEDGAEDEVQGDKDEDQDESDSESESESDFRAENRDEPDDYLLGDDELLLNDSEADGTGESTHLALSPKLPRRRVQIPPSPQPTAPLNAPVTPVPSSGMQEVITAMSDLIEDKMRSFFESLQEERRLEMVALQEERQRDMAALREERRLEMVALREERRLELADLRKRQDALENAMKAGEMATTSQNQMVATTNAIQAVSQRHQAQEDSIEPSGHSSTELNVQQHHEMAAEAESEATRNGASLRPSTEDDESQSRTIPRSALPVIKDGEITIKVADGWEPPMEAPRPGPKKSRIRVRGSKISRHPLMMCDPPPGKSAYERALERYGKGNDEAKNGP